MALTFDQYVKSKDQEAKNSGKMTFDQYVKQAPARPPVNMADLLPKPQGNGYVSVADLNRQSNGSGTGVSLAGARGTFRNNYGYGNLDLTDRPIYVNPDGSYSTVRSLSVGFDDDTVLIPTVGWDANRNPVSWTEDEAIQHYLQTGEHLGKFATVEAADQYGQWLHNQQEAYYNNNPTVVALRDRQKNGKSTVAPGTPGGGGRGTTPANQTFFGSVGQFFKELPTLVGEGVQVAAQNRANMATDDIVDPLEAAGIGTFRAMGALPVGEAAAQGIAAISGDEKLKANADNVSAGIANMYQEAQAQNPAAYQAGNILGTIMLMSGISQGMGAVPGYEKLPALAKGIIGGAGSFGASSAIQNAGDVAAGRMTPGEYAKNVGVGTLSGAAGGAAGYGVGALGGHVLTKLGLTQNTLARAVTAGISGAGYAGGRIGVNELAKYLEYPEGYKPDGAQIAQDLLVAFAFSTLSYIASAGPGPQQAAQEKYSSKYFNENMTEEEAQRVYRDLAKQFHPDLHPGDADAAATMAQVNADYEALQRIFAIRHVNAAAEAYKTATTTTGPSAQAAADKYAGELMYLREAAGNGALVGTEAADAVQILSAAQIGAAATAVNAPAPGVNAPATSQTSNPYQEALDAAGGKLPQYQPVERPVDAQRAQVGAEIAQRVTAQQNAPAAQSANIAPVAARSSATAEEGGFTGESGQRYTAQQAAALAAIPHDGIVNAGDFAPDRPITASMLGMSKDSPEWQALEKAGLVWEDDGTAVAPAIFDERARRGKSESHQVAVFANRGGVPQTTEAKTAPVKTPANVLPLEQRVTGDALYNAQDLIDTVRDVGADVDDNGYVTVYHRTSPENAERIQQTGIMQAKEDGVFFSTKELGQNEGYGDAVVALRIPAEKLELDDIFDDEAHVKIPLGRQRQVNVAEYLVKPENTVYNAGNEPKEGMTNGGEETAGSVRPDNSGLRSGRANGEDVEGRVPGETERPGGTEGSGQTLSRGTGKETVQVKDRGAAKDLEVGNLTFGDEVDASYFGIKDANPNTKFRIVTSGETQHMKNAKNIASGSELIAYYGEEFSAGGKDYIEAGWVSRANKIFAPVNSKLFTIDHYVGHEVCHREIDRGNISLKSILDQAKVDLSAGSLEEALGIYDVLYPENDDVENLTELICDAAGNMNRIRAYGWQDVDRFIDTLDEVLSAIHNMVDEATGGMFSTVPGIKDDAIPTNNSVAQADNPQALRNFNAETGMPDDLGQQIETPTDELKFSRSFDSQYMEAAIKANDKLKNVKPAVMKKAQKDRESVKEQLDKVSDMLPPDITGNTWYQDSSYGGSEENSTVCVRSLAYEEFMDSVAEQLGRPLTVSDTVFISQEAMAMTDKPECLYCYVAMDRKSYRQFLGEYIDQRDAFLADVKAGKEVGLVEPVKKGTRSRLVPKGTAYGDFLNGRANTPATYRRAKLWLDSGKLITKKDLASASAMNKAAQGDLKAQIADAQAYAQSASWAKKKNGYAAYNNHILKWSAAKVKKLNQMYGMRMYSFSDYSPAFILENMQMVTDAAVKGLKVLAYSKELDFVRIFAPTGMNINISVFGYNDGKGGAAMDAMQGADWEQAKLLREQYPNVGCTFVATNDKQVDWALAQDWIDVVIPFHLVRTGAKVADMFGWTNYTQMESDKKNPNWTPGNKDHIYPNEHQNDKAAYLELCEENNLTPRFEKWVDNPNYMKLVNETRLSEAETPAVQPIFNTEYAEGSIKEMVKRGGYMQHIGGTTENMNELAKETAAKIRAKDDSVKYSTAPDAGAEERLKALDKKYLAAVDGKDMETAQRMVDEAAKAAGYTVRAWHQTARDFTVFNTNNPGAALNDSETPNGIFFKTNDHDIGLEGKKQMPMFLKLGRTLDFKNREEANAWYRKNIDGYDELSKKMDSAIKPIDGQMQEIENQMFAESTTDEEYERLDKEWNALLEKMHVEEDKYRGQLRALLDGYFLGKNKPYDSIHLGYDGHRYVEGKRENVETYIVFSNKQAKSANPVTYDDNGNVIPLSDRFNPENEDIRFSTAPSIARLEEENEHLRQRLAEARAETKVTKGWRADPKDVAAAAKTIAESASSTYSQPMLQSRLTKLVEEASNGEISEDEVMATAGSIARDVVEKSTVLASKDLTSYNTAKNYLKKVYIEVPEALRDSFDDFKTFAQTHKEMRMNTEGVPIADVYAELQRDLGKEYFPDIARAKDMLQQIGDVMNSLAPVYGNQYSFAMQMVIEEMSNEVLEAAMDIGQKITYADRAAAKLGEAKAETKAATEKLKTAESYIRSLQRIATRRMEQNEALKQHYADTRKRQKEARDLRQSQDKLLRVLKRLNNRKLPMATKDEILDAQNAIAGVVDTVQKYFTGELKAKKWTDQGITDIGQLQEYIRRKTEPGLDPELYDPNFTVDGATKRILDRYKMTSVKDMTATQLKELTQALLNIEAKIAADKKFVNSQLAMDFYQAGEEVMGDIASAKPGTIQRKLRPSSAILRMVDWNEDNPLFVAYKEMLYGEEEAYGYVIEALKPFKELLSDHKWLKTMSGKDAKAIKITGRNIDGNPVTVEITPMMRIDLYLNSLNDDNFRDLYESGGGGMIPDMTYYRKGDMTKAMSNAKRVFFTRPVLQNLINDMDDREKAYVKLLQQYYNHFAPDHMNPVSMALDGWEKFTTENYYPIARDSDFLTQDYEQMMYAADPSLAQPGWGEERTHSVGPIYIMDANARFMRMLQGNSMYACQAIPLHNMNRLLGVKLIGQRDTVISALNRQFPDKSAKNYIEKFMSDYAGHRGGRKNPVDKAMDKLRSNYTQGVLALSFNTAAIQFASYPTAAAVVSPAALLQALTPAKADTSFIDKYTTVFTKRTEGFSMLELAEARNEGKYTPKILNPIQAVDVGTTSLLKRAAYFEVRNTRKDLEPGTKAFEQAVVNVYSNIIWQTQPNYSTALRPEVLRSDSSMERAMIMLATQPLQQYNIMYDAIGRYESAIRHYKTDKTPQNKAKVKQAQKGVARAAGVLLASSLLLAILRLGVDVVLGNYEKKYKAQDENDTDLAAFARQFGMNMVGGITGMWPIGKSGVEFVMAITDIISTGFGGRTIFGKKWYGYELSTISALSDATKDFVNAVYYVVRAANGKSETKTAVKKVITAAEDICLLLGIPAQRIHTYVKAIAHWAGLEEDDLYDLIK